MRNGLPDPADPGMSAGEIRALLLNVSEDERVEWLAQVAVRQPYAAFALARRARLARTSAKKLVELTVDSSDASTIRWWMEFYAYNAGLRNTLALLEEWHTARPRIAQYASYWIRDMPGAGTVEGRRLIEEFASRIGG